MIRLLPAVAIAGFTASAQAELTEERINKLVGDYIRENPKVILDSLQAYQRQADQNRRKEQQKLVEEKVDHFYQDDLHYGEAGNPDGDVTIVEFFDYNCPACKMMFESIDSMLLEDKQVRVVFVEMPIFGEKSDKNAMVSLAVNALAPEKYYKFHAAIMRQKGKVDSEQLLDVAANLGIDREKLKEEAAKDKYQKLISQDRALAREMQITGTPAAIINGQIYPGAMRLNQLLEAIETERKKEKSE